MGYCRRCRRAGRGALRALGGFALAAALAAAGVGAAYCQEALARDTIFARKILMDAIEDNMVAIEAAVNSGQPIDLDRAQTQADTISAMLLAFPHLFPPSTNQWRPDAARDPAHDTFASPEVWTRYSDFNERAAAASDLAHGASRTKREADYIKAIMSLRGACNGCHADYLKTDQ